MGGMCLDVSINQCDLGAHKSLGDSILVWHYGQGS
jgi:hypothetical protein